MLISAVIITYNEEKNIARCIESLNAVADEIIVVDSFSSDRTKEICSNYPNTKFFEQKWLGYSQQKNYANSLASYDYILSIDADEAVSEELKQSIDNIDFHPNVFYSVNRLTNYCGKWIRHCGWYPDSRIRIFHKSVNWSGDFVHETLLLPDNAEIKRLEGNLLHYSFYSTSEHIKRIDNYSTLSAKECFVKGKKINLLGLLIKPSWKFIRDYFFKLGFLDGFAGYQVCKISAFATFLKYTKLREYYREKK